MIKNVEEPSKDWKKEIVDYLERFMLLDNRVEVKEVKTRSTRYVLMSGELYQRSFFGPYQKCLNGEECRAILREVHEGECGNQAGADLQLRKFSTWAIIG